jgi:serine/threonine-protein kinase
MALASSGRLLAGRYRVLGRLGAGGMAVVVLAEDERLGRKVAVKRLRSESPDDAGRRFEREAKLGASLNHPNIVAVYDIVTDEDGVLIVMEYVDGRTLRLEMDSGPMSPARAIEVLSGMAAALDHAHENGVVHRDVKPANVLIAERDGAVKLTDLGIATAAERTHITNSGVVLGTAAYMAPERLDGRAGDAAVDVYATAAVAFEMLSGVKAVTGRTAVEVARRVIEAPPADLAEVVPDAPAGAAAVLKRGLAKDPAHRPATVGELVRELAGAYAEAAMRPGPGPPAAAAVVGRVAEPAPPPEPVAAPRTPEAPVGRAAPPRAPEAPVGRAAHPHPPAAPPRRPGTRRAWLVAALLAAAAALVLAVVLIAAPGEKRAKRAAAPAATTTAPTAHGAKPGSPAAPPAPAPAPAKTLTHFYTLAANDDYAGAWALGTPNLHGQFGSLDRFRATLSTLQSISFPTLSVAGQTAGSATVAFSSVAQHTDRTDRCTGTASMVRQASGWLVDHISVNCS